MPEDSLHLDEVNHTLESFFSSDRYLNGTGICSENILKLADNFKEVRARTVHLVHITDTGHIVFVSLAPYGFRLGFNTTYGAESSYRTVKHTERAFNFHSEVNVPRSVNKVDLELIAGILPESGGSGRSNCDTTFLFLFHPVHRCSAIVNFADLVSKTGVEKNTLGSSGLTGIDVSHDTDITRIF